ncbi:MAG: hypothetical protein JNK87_39920 [Bryobacterales bacterium]|nr:hypothetical protein [Bryobacterales bacterium]
MAAMMPGPQRRKQSAPVLIFELQRTLDFLSSAALTRTMAEASSGVWNTHDDDLFLMPVMGMGAKAQHVDQAALGERYDRIYRRMAEMWQETMKAGPEECVRFLSRLEENRQQERQVLETAARAGVDQDQDMKANLAGAIHSCERVRLEAAIEVAAATAGASLLTAANVEAVGTLTPQAAAKENAGRTLASNVITRWQDAAKAKVVAVSGEHDKFAGKELAEHDASRWVMDTAEAAHDQVRQQCVAKMKQAQHEFLEAVGRRGVANAERVGKPEPLGGAAVTQSHEAMLRALKPKIGAAVFYASQEVLQRFDDFVEE